MKPKSIITDLSEILGKNKLLRACLSGALIIAALALFLTSGVFRSCAKQEEEPKREAAPDAEERAASLERRLEAMLSSMAGVGRAKVMLEFDSTEEQIIATDSRSRTEQGGSTEESKPATVSSGGGESPIVLKEKLPQVRGVIVAAEGAGNFSVRMNIIAAVSTVLGVDESRVEVFVMAG